MTGKGLIMTTVLTAMLMACSNRDAVPTDEPQQTTGASDTLPQIVMQVQKCSRLYTTEIKVHKIVTHDDVVRLKGNFMSRNFNIPLPLGERKVAIPMDATLKAYIDFADFSEKNIERDGQRITVILPDPQVMLTSTKIDQKGVKEYVGLTRSHFTDKELTDYEQQGRQAILNSIPQLGIVETAQENAARVLVPMIAQMGYREEDITIAFRKDLDIKSLFKLEKKNE
jgi:hypothetical protein